MCLVRLKDACHYSTLDEEIGEPGDRQRIEEVHLEEGLVADMITVEWNTLDKGNMRDKYRGVGVVGIASVREGQGMIYGEGQVRDIFLDLSLLQFIYLQFIWEV